MQDSKNVANCNKTALVSMEEEYMRLQIDYTLPNDRTGICTTIDAAEKEFDLYPQVVHKRNDQGGSYCIEFDKELYRASRAPGDFIEKVLKELDIQKCEER